MSITINEFREPLTPEELNEKRISYSIATYILLFFWAFALLGLSSVIINRIYLELSTSNTTISLSRVLGMGLILLMDSFVSVTILGYLKHALTEYDEIRIENYKELRRLSNEFPTIKRYVYTIQNVQQQIIYGNYADICNWLNNKQRVYVTPHRGQLPAETPL